jgi:sigma-B regulation protein RsbU (phosphoserine phosphatase)
MNCAVPEPSTSASSLRVLIADDHPDVLEAIRLLLKGAGHRVMTADSPKSLLAAAVGSQFDLILMDMNYSRDTTSGEEGLKLVSLLRSQPHATPIVVMTAWGDVQLAVEAMRRGAIDFVQKPWNNARLLETITKRAVRPKQSEMEIARRVQQKLLPEAMGTAGSVDFAAACHPAKEIGGDFFDFHAREGGFDFVLGDVSGKGLPAALLMASLQASIRTQWSTGALQPGALLPVVNQLFHDATAPEHYATLFVGSWNEQARTLRYVNCGHHAPLVLRASGDVERLRASCSVLGMFRKWECVEAEIGLCSGDSVVLFSDGVVEAGLAHSQEFGEERIEAVVRATRLRSAQEMMHVLVTASMEFENGEQGDDLTVMVLRVR